MSHQMPKQANSGAGGATKASPSTSSHLSRWEYVQHFVRLGRPKFLLYSWVLHTLGVAAATYLGHEPSLSSYLHGQLYVWCLHLMTHYCNEYFDLEADSANPSPTGWTGGSRVLVQGLIEPRVSLSASFVLLFVCLMLIPAMPNAAQYPALIGLTLFWFYTAPPIQLNYRGLGEVTVSAVLNGSFPMVGYAMTAGKIGCFPWLLLVPAFLIQFVRMTIMNLLDYKGDMQVGKHTLVVKLGPQRIIHLHAAAQALAYTLIFPAVRWGMPRIVAMCVAMTLPLALWHVARIYRGAHLDPRTANSVPFWASTHISLVVAFAFVGLLIDGYQRGIFHFDGIHALFLLPLAAYGIIIVRQIQQNRPMPVAT